MKTIFFAAVLFLLITNPGIAQKPYSRPNLEKLSTEQLNEYLSNAKKIRRKGGYNFISGTRLFVSGIALGNYAWSGGTEAMWTMSLGMMAVGLGATIISIPIFVSGASKYSRVADVMKKRDFVRLEIAPSNLFDSHNQNTRVGLAFRITY
jgi:hypothetical protein